MPGLLEHNAGSHLIWLVGGAIWGVLALVVALDLFDRVMDRLRDYRRRHSPEAVPPVPPSADAAAADEPGKPDHALAGRLLRRDPRLASGTFRPLVPVRRTWNEGRLDEPFDDSE